MLGFGATPYYNEMTLIFFLISACGANLLYENNNDNPSAVESQWPGYGVYYEPQDVSLVENDRIIGEEINAFQPEFKSLENADAEVSFYLLF